MAQINFPLSSVQASSGGSAGSLNAGGVADGGGQLRDPADIHAPVQEAETYQFNTKNVPLLDHNTFEQGAAQLVNAAAQYRDRTDDLYAEDAAMRARIKARNVLINPNPGKDGAVGFLQRQGKDAVDVNQMAQQAIDEVYSGGSEGLSDNAKAKYLTRIANFRETDLNRVAEHTVKQQAQYAGQVDYARSSLFLDALAADPVAAMNSGEFEYTLSKKSDLQDQEAFKQKVISQMVDGQIDNINLVTKDNPNAGWQTAQQLVNRYGGAFSAESRLVAEKKIYAARNAAEERTRKLQEDSRQQDQQQVRLGAPIQISRNLASIDGAGLVDTLNKVIEISKPPNLAEAQRTIAGLLEDSFQSSYFTQTTAGADGTDVIEGLKSQYYATRQDAESKGLQIPQGADIAAVRKFQDLEKQEADRTELRQQKNARAVLDTMREDEHGVTFDTKTLKDQRVLSDLPTSVREHVLATQHKYNSDVKNSSSEQEMSDKMWSFVALAQNNQLTPGSPAYKELMEMQADPAKRFDQKSYTFITSCIDGTEKAKKPTDVQSLGMEKVIDNNAHKGLYSNYLQNTRGGKKPYTDAQLDNQSIIMAAQEKQIFYNWRLANPAGDVYQYDKDRTAQIAAAIVPGASGLLKQAIGWTEDKLQGGAPSAPEAQVPQALAAPVPPAPAQNPTRFGEVAAPGGISLQTIRTMETGGDPNAVSSAGAVGTMGTMPATLKDPGLGVAPARNESKEERERVGADYWNALVKRYAGDSTLAAVAYNMGPGATDKWLASGGDPAKLPKETKDYISKAHALSAVEGWMAKKNPPATTAPVPPATTKPAPPPSEGAAKVKAYLDKPENAEVLKYFNTLKPDGKEKFIERMNKMGSL